MNAFWRVVMFVVTMVVIVGGTILAIFYARGYRVNLSNKSVGSTGLLVATSQPNGAQVWVNGVLKSATNSTLDLAPGKYSVELKRDGFSTWKKNLTIKAEEVVKTEAVLFPVLPNLRPVTFNGVNNPTLAPLGDRLVYATPLSGLAQAGASTTPAVATPSGSPTTAGVAGQSGVQNQALANQLPTRSGLWVLDLFDMPLGFSREPRQIAQSTAYLDWSKAVTFWSPDERQILAVFLTKTASIPLKSIHLGDLKAAYLLDGSRLNSAGEMVDISADIATLAAQWQNEKVQTATSQMAKVPEKVRGILASAISDFKFSPDETKVLYLATASATLPEDVLPYLPGSDTQAQQRQLHTGGVYVYDLKEDRNFWIRDNVLPSATPKAAGAVNMGTSENFDLPSSISWFPTSRHLIWLSGGQITILEYDGTNAVTVYTGPFADDDVFSSSNGTKLIILTDLGSGTNTANLYSLILQ